MRVNRVVAHHGKPIHYRTDGTGRDGYIHQHNGGFISQEHVDYLTLQSRDHSPRFTFAKRKYLRPKLGLETTGNNRFVHYLSDGTGRDNYVGRTEGGNSTPYDWKENTNHRFISSLRAPKLPTLNPEKNEAHKTIRGRCNTEPQEDLSKRLSLNKHPPTPPPVSAYFSTNFDATRQFCRMHTHG